MGKEKALSVQAPWGLPPVHPSAGGKVRVASFNGDIRPPGPSLPKGRRLLSVLKASAVGLPARRRVSERNQAAEGGS